MSPRTLPLISGFVRMLNITCAPLESLYQAAARHHRSGHIAQAESLYRQVLAASPQHVETLHMLAVAIFQARRDPAAIDCLRQAIQINPADGAMHFNLGLMLNELGRYDEALQAYHASLALPAHTLQPESHLGISRIHLARGEFAQGWPHYEFRRQCASYIPEHYKLTAPMWDGSRFDGKTLFLHTEQGFGDAIQFVRFAPLVARFGGQVILDLPRELARLIDHFPGAHRCSIRGEPLPQFDLHCPLMSVPGILGITPQTIPDATPYIAPPVVDVQRWRALIRADEQPIKIGIAAAGRPTHLDDWKRSLHLTLLAPLWEHRGTSFYNLQKTPAEGLPPGYKIYDYAGEFKDFADTAGLIANLDLVITVDTAAAHLAAAIGKPTWILLPAIPDWRWMLDGATSPWYASARLFRQQAGASGNWAPLVKQLHAALGEFCKSNRERALTPNRA